MTRQRRVPETGPIGLGAATLGHLFTDISDDDAIAVVHASLDHGVRYIDTSPMYGLGESERRIGVALAGRPRHSYVVSTKVGRPADDGRGGEPPRFDFGADGVRRSLEGSMRRLQVDHLDIVYIHDPDDHLDEAVSGAYAALDDLRSQGVVGAIGVGTNSATTPMRFVTETDVDVVLVAGRYTLLDTSAADELFDACRDRSVTVVAAGVYNSGVLADPVAETHYDYRPVSDDVLARAVSMQDICARHGVPLPAAALAFTSSHPAVSSVLVGMRSVDEVGATAALWRRCVPAPMWKELVDAGHLPARLAPQSG